MQNENSDTFDITVIGGGPGGYVAAIRAAQLGFKVACIDKRPALGGTCLIEGCIPSKALLQSTEHYAFFNKQAKTHGIECSGLNFNLSQMMQRKSTIVTGLTDGIAGLMKKNKITRIEGEARFVDQHHVDIFNADNIKKQTIESKYFIIATGSEPISLPFLPFDEEHVISSTGALSLSEVPKKLAVIGGGVIGVELASVYSRLGSQVIVIEMLDEICPAMDKTMSKGLLQILKKQGIGFFLSAKLTEGKIDKDNHQVSLQFTQEGKALSENADVVLVAVGRRPFTGGLDLKNIGITTNSKGFIPVDGQFRTEVSHIFAIGDVIEGVMLAHRASEEGVAVAELIGGLNPHINYMAIPNVIYTHPEVVSLGMTEQEAKDAGFEIKVGTFPFRANARARCYGEDDGLVKIIGEAKSGRVLGMHIIGQHASEMIGEGVIALEKKATLSDIANASHAHPSLAEAIKEAALNALGRTIHI